MNKNTYDISPIKRVTRKLLEVSRCSRANEQRRNVQKNVLHVQSCFFVLIRPIVVFSSFLLPSPLKVMLHGTIRKDDFKRNTSLQCWNNVVTIRNHVTTMLKRCSVALKIVLANRLVEHHLYHYTILYFVSTYYKY